MEPIQASPSNILTLPADQQNINDSNIEVFVRAEIYLNQGFSPLNQALPPNIHLSDNKNISYSGWELEQFFGIFKYVNASITVQQKVYYLLTCISAIFILLS